MKLSIALDGGTIVLARPREAAAGEYALLQSVDTIRQAVQAPHVGADDEAPSLTVTLDNARGAARALLGIPLRAPASVEIGGAVVFAGVVARVRPGLLYVLTLEA